MPHFIIECSKEVLNLHKEEELSQQVYTAAVSTKLFHKHDVKVRIVSFEHYCTGEKKENFIHVFANIMEGRSMEQKAGLSKMIVRDLASMFDTVKHIACNIIEFEKASYFNKNMLDPNYTFSMP